MKVSTWFLLSCVLNPSSIFTAATSACKPGVWTKFSDQAMKYVATSADGKHIWALDPVGQVYYRNGKHDIWRHIDTPETFTQIAVNGDGSHVWALDVYQNDLYRNGATGDWIYMIDNAKNWIHVSLAADGNEVIALDEAFNVWQRFGYEGYWIRRTGSLKKAVLTGDGEYGWGVDQDDNVWYRPGRLEKWVQLAGELSDITVSSDGEHVWGCNCRGTIYYRNGKSDSWKSVDAGGSATIMSVTSDGLVYKVDVRNEVSTLDGFPGKVTEDRRARREIQSTTRRLRSSRRLGDDMSHSAPTEAEKAAAAAAKAAQEAAEADAVPLKEISVSESGNDIYAVDNMNRAWHTLGINHAWEQVDLGVIAGVQSLSVGPNGYLWAVTSDGIPAVREGVSAQFETRHGSGMRNIEATADGTLVYLNHNSGVMYYRNSLPGNWWIVDPEVSHRAKHISTSADGSQLWYVNASGNVFYRPGWGGAQEEILGVSLKQIAVSGDGHHVWGVTAGKEVYYRNGYSGTWIEAGGPAMDYVSVNGDGSNLYGVDSDLGKTYTRTCYLNV